MSHARANQKGHIGHYVIMVVLAAFFLFPLAYMFASAFKADDAVLGGSDSLGAFLPSPWVGLDNFRDAVERASFPRVFLNSVIISGSIVALGLVVNSLFGYALSRMRFAGQRLLVIGVIALIIVPFEALAVPLLYLSASLGWLDTYHVQILPFVASPLFIYLFYSFFLNIPVSLEEAARVDGAGPVRIFVSVVAPLAKPAYATVAILGFLFSWGQLLWPVMVTRGVDVRPLPLGIGTFMTTPPVQWGDIMAYAAMMTVPLVIIFLIFQRYFVRGVAATGVKG
ncbi:carbohydrate ABC transporter permease [Natronosporangium hydrolyticum]|uniref:Carbohydrate ABC transporter permease n=1 Tax=Natronosporangium hydrolyticum TaxID=2811111 RepID=A0A895Y700_9ACTN|nr:carbohydrate ABC transporter permease [Natronosporangium hydrolyticum]QSB13141.1 carbohydrate ABC transporter permease [Natronosporangium hydrolyticum]